MNITLSKIVTLLVLCGFTMLMNASAQVPRTLNYQGYLTNPSGSAINSPALPITVKLYLAASGGSALYSETQNLAVTNGIFNMVIGSVTPLNLTFDAPYYLGVTVGADAEMSPRQPLTASPYALRSASTESVALGRGGQTVTTIDSPGDVGQYNAVTIGTDGFPVISYYDGSNSSLKVAKCVNANCTGSSILTTVDNAGDVGRHTSITIGTDGFPVISYLGVPNTLKVAKCVNEACTGTSTITTVDPATGTNSIFSSVVIGADGFPVISYGASVSLRIAKCADAACAQPATLTTIPVGTLGTSIMTGVDGLPVIASPASVSTGTALTRCTNASCTTWTTRNLDTSGASSYQALAISGDGLPIFSYFENTAKAFKVTKCLDSTCGVSLAAPIATTVLGTYGTFSAMDASSQIVIGADGLPLVSFMNPETAALVLYRCATFDCTGVASVATLVPGINPQPLPPGTRLHHSLTVGNDGLPVISYYDSVGGNLRVIKCASVGCAAPSRRR
jgi:hypothetical protein